MIIFLHGSPDKTPVADHTVIICPARDIRMPIVDSKLGLRAEPPEEWLDNVDGEMVPKQMPIRFHYGQAEVPDAIGKYMIDRGLAQKTRLVLPNSWN